MIKHILSNRLVHLKMLKKLHEKIFISIQFNKAYFLNVLL